MCTELLIILCVIQFIINVILFSEIGRISKLSRIHKVMIDMNERRFDDCMRQIGLIERHVDDLYDRAKEDVT